MRLRTILLLLLGLAAPVHAGEPVEQEIVCPIGGETFLITGTSSCSVLGRTMSFRPVTSCDFVTRLPVCPGNGLPLFDRFTESELARLPEILESAEFQQDRTAPAWQRAFYLANRIGRENSATTFRLLLNALWYEPETFLENPDLIAQLLAQVNSEKSRVAVENHAFLDAIAAYVLGATGQSEKAHRKLARLRANPATPPALEPFMARLETCLSDWSAEACAPDAPMPEG